MKTVRLLFGMAVVFFMAFAPVTAKAHKGHTKKHRHGVYTPYWVPAHVVRANMRHVYFPQYEVYFDRWNGTFIYLSGRRWVVSTQLPYGLRGVNFARAYKVGLAIDSSRPYVYHARHRANYYRNYNNGGYRYKYQVECDNRNYLSPQNGKYYYDDSRGNNHRNRNSGERDRRRN